MPPKKELSPEQKATLASLFRNMAKAQTQDVQTPKRVKTKKKADIKVVAHSEPVMQETKQQGPRSRNLLKTGDLIFGGKYRIEKRLGSGSFGVVYLCTIVQSGETVAVKIILIDTGSGSDIEEELLNEVTVQQKLTPHPNLVPLLDIAWDRPSGWLGLVMPYARWGDLYAHLGRLRAQEKKAQSAEQKDAHNDSVAQLGRDILCGLAHMHKHKVVHQDLKPENILVYDHPNPRYPGHVVCKIADFGFSMRLESTYDFRYPIATPLWRAPEIDCIPQDIQQYTPAADVWSLGIVFLELFFGLHPFIGSKDGAELTSRRLVAVGASSSDVAKDSDCAEAWRALSCPAPNKKWQELEAKLVGKKALSHHWTEEQYANIWTLIFDCLQYNPKARLSTSDLIRLPVWNKTSSCESERHLTTKEMQDSDVHIDRLYELAVTEFKMPSDLLKDATHAMDIAAAIMVRFAVVRPDSMLNSWKSAVRTSYKMDTVLLALCFYLASRTTQNDPLSKFLASKLDLLVKEKRWIAMQLDILNALGWNIDGHFDPKQATQEYCSSFVPGLFSLPDSQISISNLKGDNRLMQVASVRLVPKDKVGHELGSFVFEEPKSVSDEEHWIDKSAISDNVYSTSGLFDTKFCAWQRSGTMSTIDVYMVIKNPVPSLVELLKTHTLLSSVDQLFQVKLLYHPSEWSNAKVPEELPSNVYSSTSTNWLLELDSHNTITLSWELQILYL